ncbi:hypoxia induced protein conserved region-domain-containing protein [Parachaetomium inaequale]|uniref:Hypoxia induced protein conserved region-domain-containing protein n=1 Tax=Parachaetomium inaequale TaxID=2588326 RepID=A0AAN6SQW9_9PEZI|nr:hypoxia induced protein conserved region-domain-containing protein [Parachaetomium inaequale]
MSDRPLSGRPLPSSFDDNQDFYNESGFQKVLRKLKEEPLVPIGCLLTVAAFTNAYRAMRRGDHQKVQRMFRARVAAQGFTVLAMVAGGMYYAEDRNKQKELWKLKQQQEAEEKRQKWIKELEARDEEEKALQELVNKKRKRAAERTANTETGAEGVAAQARAALKEARAVKGEAADAGTTELPSQAADGEKNPSGGVLGSLGGWFGGSSKTPEDPTKDPKGPKPESEGSR